jgi:23S rRNA (adenine1618-N6)-methyltransferase
MKKERRNLTKNLHRRNLHNRGYVYASLVSRYSVLKAFVRINEHGNESIDFSDPAAVKALNCALLRHHYSIENWDIPAGYLCPPIPGRVDYIHYVADLLGVEELQETRSSSSAFVKMLDIGTGANGIYSLLASRVYGWDCTASDIDPYSLENVSVILSKNPDLEGRIQLRLQSDNSYIFNGIIQPGECYDVSVCNPPFHASLEEALKGSQKKLANLASNRKGKSQEPSEGATKGGKGGGATLNFGGQKAELWCNGGEIRFLRKMIKESKGFGQQCRWFTTLVSKSENLKPCHKLLRKVGASEIQEIEMKQGNKITRVLAWTFVSSRTHQRKGGKA